MFISLLVITLPCEYLNVFEIHQDVITPKPVDKNLCMYCLRVAIKKNSSKCWRPQRTDTNYFKDFLQTYKKHHEYKTD